MSLSIADLGVEHIFSQDGSDLILNQLRKVTIKAVSGTLAEMEYIKLILAKSPILERLVVAPHQRLLLRYWKIWSGFNGLHLKQNLSVRINFQVYNFSKQESFGVKERLVSNGSK